MEKLYTCVYISGFPGGTNGIDNAGDVRDSGFDPWVGKIPWRRKQHPTPVFLPGESHGQRRLASYTVHGIAEFDTAEQLTHSLFFSQSLRNFPNSTLFSIIDNF